MRKFQTGVVVLLAGIFFFSLSNPTFANTQPGEKTSFPPTQQSGPVLWAADMETGDLSQWDANNGGGEYNSGKASSSASGDVARSGSWSAKMTITTPSSPTSGVRLFRWGESRSNPALYYSAWFYFPRRYDAPEWWNIWQWKTSTSSANDPYFLLDVGNRPDGSMYIYLYDWVKRVAYQQTAKNIPEGQWTHIEGYYRCASDNTGQVTIWQDGVQLLDVANVQTRYSGGDCQWSIDNYSSSLDPSPAIIYADDAAIGTGRMP